MENYLCGYSIKQGFYTFVILDLVYAIAGFFISCYSNNGKMATLAVCTILGSVSITAVYGSIYEKLGAMFYYLAIKCLILVLSSVMFMNCLINKRTTFLIKILPFYSQSETWERVNYTVDSVPIFSLLVLEYYSCVVIFQYIKNYEPMYPPLLDSIRTSSSYPAI